MPITITKINDVDLKEYHSQKNVRRRKTAVGGFDAIVYATDQDLDGMHIRGLLTGFIEKYLPEFKDKVGMLKTPVMLYTKNGKVTGWKYSLDDETEFKGDAMYVKGLGSWDAADLKHIVEKEGLEKMIQFVDFEGLTGQKLIKDWLGNDSAPRKQYILNNDFQIAKI